MVSSYRSTSNAMTDVSFDLSWVDMYTPFVSVGHLAGVHISLSTQLKQTGESESRFEKFSSGRFATRNLRKIQEEY